LVEGRFRDRRAALRFARHQYPGDGVTIVFLGEKKPRASEALAIAGRRLCLACNPLAHFARNRGAISDQQIVCAPLLPPAVRTVKPRSV